MLLRRLSEMNDPQTKNDRQIPMAARDARRGGLRARRIGQVRQAGSLPSAGPSGDREERMASLTFLAGQYKAGRALIDVWARGVAVAAIGRAMK